MENISAHQNGNRLEISLPFEDGPFLSASKRSLIYASTHGNFESPIIRDDGNLLISANAFIRLARNGIPSERALFRSWRNQLVSIQAQCIRYSDISQAIEQSIKAVERYLVPEIVDPPQLG